VLCELRRYAELVAEVKCKSCSCSMRAAYRKQGMVLCSAKEVSTGGRCAVSVPAAFHRKFKAHYWLVVWHLLNLSDGVFGCFDLATLLRLPPI